MKYFVLFLLGISAFSSISQTTYSFPSSVDPAHQVFLTDQHPLWHQDVNNQSGKSANEMYSVASLWDTIVSYYQDTMPSRMYIRSCDWRGEPLQKITLIRNAFAQWMNDQRITYTYDFFGWPETMLYETGNGNGGWENSLHETYTHSPEGYLLSRLTEEWNGSSWRKSRRNSFTYNASGDILTYLIEDWIDGAWKLEFSFEYNYDDFGSLVFFRFMGSDTLSDGRRNTFIFDESGDQVQQLVEVLNMGIWDNSEKYTYTYDSAHLRLTEVKDLWQSGEWNHYYKYSYTYNAQGLKSSETNEGWSASGWFYGSRWSYTYNGNGDCIVSLLEYHEDEEWVPYSKEVYEFDAFFRLKSVCYSYYTESLWEFESRYDYEYDDYSNLLSRVYAEWEIQHWQYNERWIYTYDEYGNSLTGHHNSWNGSDWIPSGGNLDVYENGSWATAVPYYSSYSAHYRHLNTDLPKPPDKLISGLKIYPNPVNEYFTVHSTLFRDKRFNYQIYNSHGNLLITDGTLTGNELVDVRMLASGVYYLKITDGTSIAGCSFIRQ